MNEIITIDRLTKDYGHGKGIFDVSFSVKEGEVFGYLGPNGAGKSTTIRQLMGFIRPDSGQCSILGMDCFKNAAKIQSSLGYLAGEIAFMEDMTGKAYLNFMAEMKGMHDKSRMQELLDRFELDCSGKLRKMSKGMKQKIAIVCAFMNEPSVAILDEPTSGLDPLMQNRFVELILEEKKKGTTILMSSHIFEEVEKTCDRTAIIRNGKIAAIEEMDNLTKKKKKIYTVTVDDALTAVKLSHDPMFEIDSIHNNQVSLLVSDNVAQTLQRIALYQPKDLEIHTQNLEELFLHYYGEERACND